MTPRTSSRTSQGDVYVTWGMLDRVLELALNPIIEKLDEVHTDVRALRDDRSERQGAAGEQRRWRDSRSVLMSIAISICSAGGGIGYLIAYLIHGT